MRKFLSRLFDGRDMKEFLDEFKVRRRRKRDDDDFDDDDFDDDDEDEYYDRVKRVSGGKSFSDAMWRFNASPREYARGLGKRITDKLGISKSVKVYGSDEFFMIVKDEKPLIAKEINFVEQKRKEGAYAFETWLEAEIKALLN